MPPEQKPVCTHTSFISNYCHKQMKWATRGTKCIYPEVLPLQDTGSASRPNFHDSSLSWFAFLQSSTAMQRVCMRSDAVRLTSYYGRLHSETTADVMSSLQSVGKWKENDSLKHKSINALSSTLLFEVFKWGEHIIWQAQLWARVD